MRCMVSEERAFRTITLQREVHQIASFVGSLEFGARNRGGFSLLIVAVFNESRRSRRCGDCTEAGSDSSKSSKEFLHSQHLDGY